MKNLQEPIYGKKVILKPMQIEDVYSMMAWGTHEDRLFFDYNFPYMTEDEICAWFELKTKRFRRCFSVFNYNKQLVGYIALRNVKIIRKKSELGIVFDPNYLSEGYGTDSLIALLKWYFDTFKFKKMVLSVAAYNYRAIRCYEKVGFKKTKEYYDEFMNYKINPIEDRNYSQIKHFFRQKGEKIQVLYYKMEISTLPTE